MRDVAWAPNIGLPRSYIATASQVCRAEDIEGDADVFLTYLCLYLVIGQVCAHLDQGHAECTMGQDGSRPVPYCIPEHADNTGQVSRCCLARVVEPRGQHSCRELWRRKGDALEREPEGRLGVCERREQLK